MSPRWPPRQEITKKTKQNVTYYCVRLLAPNERKASGGRGGRRRRGEGQGPETRGPETLGEGGGRVAPRGPGPLLPPPPPPLRATRLGSVVVILETIGAKLKPVGAVLDSVGAVMESVRAVLE